jgi:hypothetical protein
MGHITDPFIPDGLSEVAVVSSGHRLEDLYHTPMFRFPFFSLSLG